MSKSLSLVLWYVCYRLSLPSHFSPSFRINPEYVSCMMSLASSLLDVGGQENVEEGLTLMKDAAKLDPLNADVHYNYGTLLSRLGECIIKYNKYHKIEFTLR